MIQQLGPFTGSEWCDLDWSPADGAFVFATLSQPGRIVLRAGMHAMLVRGTFDLGRWGLYLRAAADGAGNVCCVLQDGRDRNPATGQFYPAVVVLFPKDGPPREIPCPAGPAFGQNAVQAEGRANGWTVYVATSPTTFWRAWLTAGGAWVNTETVQWPQTSQGFADGQWSMDSVRASVPGMVCPSETHGISIGQAGEPDRIRGLHNGVYFTALSGPGFEPHLVSDGQGHWMGCARTPQGAALFTLAPPFEAEQAPPKPADDAFDVVPAGTLVQDAIATLIGRNPVQDANGIICIHKNTFPEAEWRRVVLVSERRALLHWADASRFPGDPGWWTDPAAVLCFDEFRSGETVSLEGAQIIDMRPGVPANRWRQTVRMCGLKGGGVFYETDPRFANQYTDMSKQGTPQWAPAGYEKQWTLRDGRSKWQYIVTPLTAKGVIAWGDTSMDVVIQEEQSGPQPPSAPLPFVPCPRPPSVPPEPEPKPMIDKPDLRGIPRDQIVLMAQAISLYCRENPRLGLPHGLLAPDAGVVPLDKALDATCAYLIGECLSAFQAEGPLPGDAAGYAARRDRSLSHTFHVIEAERGEKPKPKPGPAFSGPISVTGKDFMVP